MAIKNNKWKYFTILLLLVLLIPYFIVVFYAFPTKDDFCNIIVNANVSVIERLLFVYNEWSGRYIPALLGFAGKYIIGISYMYSLFLFVCMLLQVLVIYKLISIISDYKQANVIISLLISLVFFSTLPEIGEGLYWYTAVKVYSLGIILSVLYICQIIKLLQVTKVSRIRLAYIFLLAICSIGTNETTALLLVLFHVIIHFLYKQQYSNQLKSVVLIFVVFLLLSFLAPGNFERTIYIPKASMFYLFRNGIYYTLYYTITWLFHPVFIMYLGFIFLLGNFVKKTIIQLPHTIYIILIIMTIPATGIFASMFGVGELSSLRMLNPAYLFFVLSVGLVAYEYGCKSKILSVKSMQKLLLPICVIFIITSIAFSNINIVAKDFMQHRFQDFYAYNSKIVKEKKLPPPLLHRQIPQTFRYYDNPSHSNQWSLNCMKKVYAIK